MRKRARSRQTDDHHDNSKTSSQEPEPPPSTQPSSEHINFFSDIQTGVGTINLAPKLIFYNVLCNVVHHMYCMHIHWSFS